MEHYHEEDAALHKAAAAAPEAPKGRIHSLMSDYDRINHHDRENMERLGRLIMRVEGPAPEEKLNGDPHKVREPQGLLDGVERLNEKHAHHAEVISMMISKLEELI